MSEGGSAGSSQANEEASERSEEPSGAAEPPGSGSSGDAEKDPTAGAEIGGSPSDGREGQAAPASAGDAAAAGDQATDERSGLRASIAMILGMGMSALLPALVLLAIVLHWTRHLSVNVPLPVQSFYGIAAGIIPLLLIAFAVERRASTYLGRGRFLRLLLFVFLLVGELCALLGASGALRAPGSTVLRHDMSTGQTVPSRFDEGYVTWSTTGSYLIFAGTVGGIFCAFVIITAVAVWAKE